MVEYMKHIKFKGELMKPSNGKRIFPQPALKSVRNLVGLVLLIQVAIVIIGFLSSVWLGLVLLLMFVSLDFLALRFYRQTGENLDQYISNLSYQIKRGEQEAIIKLPVGIIMITMKLSG